MFTDIIRRREKDLPLFGVDVRGNQSLKVKGAELIIRSQIGRKTGPLGSSERKSSIEGTARE